MECRKGQNTMEEEVMCKGDLRNYLLPDSLEFGNSR